MDDLITYVGSFLIGSIPMGYLLVKVLKKKDLRTKGENHVGLTNVWKIAGPQLGLLVLALDVLKGAAAVTLARVVSPDDRPDWVLAGFLALAADEFPVFLKCKGGRGIGTAIGVFGFLILWMLMT